MEGVRRSWRKALYRDCHKRLKKHEGMKGLMYEIFIKDGEGCREILREEKSEDIKKNGRKNSLVRELI